MGSSRSTRAFLALGLSFAPPLAAAPTIVHVGLECIAPGRYAVVLSGIEPPGDVQSAKVYFRSELYPDFYYVPMEREGDRFVAFLPQADPSTPRVIYYLEAVDQSFKSVRSEEFAPVIGECEDDPALAHLTGETPEILVGSTAAGASAIPPGFAAAGIIGTIASTGVASAVASGIGTGVAVAGVAGAAGAAGAVVVATQGPASTTTSVAPSTPRPTSTTTTTSAGPSTTTSVPAATTTSAGPTTTSSSTTTTSAAPPLDASCFTVELKKSCHVKADAKCVRLPVDRYAWVLDTQNKFRRIDIPNGDVVANHNWTSAECAQDESITFRLTVYRGSSSSTAEKTLLVPANLMAEPPSELSELSLEARLELPSPDDRSRVRLLLDGRLVGALITGQPLSFRTSLGPGAHEIEAVVVRTPGSPGLLRLDLNRTPGLREGSLSIVQGNVLTAGPRALTLRIGSAPEERFRVRFELE